MQKDTAARRRDGARPCKRHAPACELGRRVPSQDNLDTMKTIADLRARMSGTGPGHQAALKQGIDNLRDLRGVSVERGGGRVR